MITFRGASVVYGGGVHALNDVDLDIGDGEFVVVVGLSGAGKSTLVRAINGLVPLTSGSLEVNGVNVPDLGGGQLRTLRADIGMIFQGFNLVNRTSVLNNVLMGRLHRVPTWRTLLGWYPAGDREVAMRGARAGRDRREGVRQGVQPVGRPAPASRASLVPWPRSRGSSSPTNPWRRWIPRRATS